MPKYLLSKNAKEDLIRIHQYGTKRFGESQADKYFNEFFICFELIAKKPGSFESVYYIRTGYRKCVCGVDTIFFRVIEDQVQIMAIVGRQDIEELKNSW